MSTDRRQFLRSMGAAAVSGVVLGGHAFSSTRAKSSTPSDIGLTKIFEQSVGPSLQQVRAVPVRTGPEQSRAILVVHSESPNVDPWHAYFRFPEHTLKLSLLTSRGEILWQRDIGPGIVPGTWFCPVFPFDLDGDGRDEIWYVNNVQPEHPLSLYGQRLERLDPQTGERTGRWDWPRPARGQSMSHTYRFFILGGYADEEPVLVTAQGTYGPMSLQAWNADMSRRWNHDIGGDDPGARGSHKSPVVDINGDGVDEILWGERAIAIDSGRELFCADRQTWQGHSDLILPLRDYTSDRWMIYTARENYQDHAPRVVMYDERGKRVWSDVDQGHMDKGWLARLGADGEVVALVARIEKRGEGGEKLAYKEFTYRAATGEPYPLPSIHYGTMPVDLDGDGIHELASVELVGGGTDGDAVTSMYPVLDAQGNRLAAVEGKVAMASKFLDRAGEQVLTWTADGRVHVYADENAEDRAAAKRRYESRAYQLNQQLTAVGYNQVLLGGL